MDAGGERRKQSGALRLNRALSVASAFIDALNRNDVATARRCFAPGAIWWVDTGRDRAAGQFGIDPGADRPWPLHGAMDAAAKCQMLERIGDVFPRGLRQVPRRAFAGGNFAVIEVAGDGLFKGETPYQNRYAFVFEVQDGMILEVREYLDTNHAAHVFGGKNLERRSQAPPIKAPAINAKTAVGEAGLRLLAAISAMDEQALLAVCTVDATWWADGGRRRTAGPEGPIQSDESPIISGRVRIQRRAASVSALGAMFPHGFSLSPHRLIEAEDAGQSGLAAIEAVSEGLHANGRRYQNRYCWVVEASGGKLTDIREYCDTLHGFDTLFA